MGILSILSNPNSPLGFCELLQFEGINPSTSVLQKFKSQLRSILRRHNTVVETMAEALIELKQSRGIDFSCEQNIQVRRFFEILEDFFWFLSISSIVSTSIEYPFECFKTNTVSSTVPSIFNPSHF